jgi:putative GTP pyrophosphokinase
MQTKNELFLKYQFTKKMLETEIEILINEFVFKFGYNPVEHIKSRVKAEASIKKKLEKKGYDFTIDNIVDHIHDAVGFRIVVSFLSDVYDIVAMIKNSNNLVIIGQKDYIKDPKESGYTSYHLNVLVPLYLNDKVEHVEAEIQIRTMAMDFWASLDHKIQYKFPEKIPEDVREKMYENSLIIKELDKRMMRLNETVNKYDKKS